MKEKQQNCITKVHPRVHNGPRAFTKALCTGEAKG